MRSCVVCGATVTGRGRRLYCSPNCALETRTCETCGDGFQVARKRKGRNKVCSLSCRPPRQWGQPKVDVRCGHCGETFTTHQSKIDAGRGKHCSRRCAALARPISGSSAIADESITRFLDQYHDGGTVETEKRIGRWSIDLALPEQKIAIELDGEYWHSLPAMVEKDRRKDEHLVGQGWTVIRVLMRQGESADVIARRIAEELQTCRQTT